MEIFISNDLLNPKELYLAKKLRSKKKFIVLTTSIHSVDEFKKIVLTKNLLFIYFIKLWNKYCFLISHPTNAVTNSDYINRAIHIQNPISFLLIKYFFSLKKLIPSIFMRFTNIFLLPFQVLRLKYFFYKRSKPDRVVYFDPVTVKNLDLWYYIIYFYFHPRYELIAVTRSWDNVFYAQFFSNADKYLFWSEEMMIDFQKTHQKKVKYELIGPYLFEEFQNVYFSVCNNESMIFSNFLGDSKQIKVGYACAFPDEHMAKLEIKFLEKLANECNRTNTHHEVIFFVRGYPNHSKSFYENLLSSGSRILIADFENPMIDRYDDNHEKISFDSDLHKINFLANIDFFLSVATSFSIEAVLCNRPVIHFHLHADQEFREINSYIKTADHLKKYFKDTLLCVDNNKEFLEYISNVSTKKIMLQNGNLMAKKLGF